MRRGKTDRFERLVRKGFSKGIHPSQEWVYATDAIDLLRREHRAVVRVVKEVQRSMPGREDQFACGIDHACIDILDRLNARAR